MYSPTGNFLEINIKLDFKFYRVYLPQHVQINITHPSLDTTGRSIKTSYLWSKQVDNSCLKALQKKTPDEECEQYHIRKCRRKVDDLRRNDRACF